MSFRLVETPLGSLPHLPAPARGGGAASLPLGAFLPSASSADILERLQQPGALAVTTGQQPGLFGGPLYSVHKALSAAALAAELEAAWDRPVVPIFWLAGDDHDFAEAAAAAWLDETGSLVRHALRARLAGAPSTPMWRELLGPDVLVAMDLLQRTLRDGPARDAVLEWCARHWRPEATVAGGFGAAMAELLAPFGIACFDSTHRVAKQAMAPLLLQAAERATELDSALVEREASLREAGGHPGVVVGDGASLVMLDGPAGRDRLIPERDGWTLRRSGTHVTREALAKAAAGTPELLSPNVLLRPVVERALLPTVAYVAGPGELRYLPLAMPLYDALGVPRQVPVPRWSGIIVEAQVDRVLQKFGASLEELLADGAALERRVIREDLPPQARAALESLRIQGTRNFATLRSAAQDVDPTLVRAIEGLERRANWAAERAERKLTGHLLRRRAVEMSQVGRARTAVLPGGVGQERILGLPSFQARHGSALLPAVREAAGRWYAGQLEAAPARS
ncbi:MAG: bacillithiol biosynthesis cysteine-adding enzyme BshC [Gemmatimonadales bacterium]